MQTPIRIHISFKFGPYVTHVFATPLECHCHFLTIFLSGCAVSVSPPFGFYNDTFTICSKIPLDFVLSLCPLTSKHLNNLCRSIFENVEQIHEFQNT